MEYCWTDIIEGEMIDIAGLIIECEMILQD